MARKNNNYHVVPSKNQGWAVRKAGAERVSGFAPTQRAAEKMAKSFSTNTGGGEVVIHRRDGKIRDKDTMQPAKDPFPPRDKKH